MYPFGGVFQSAEKAKDASYTLLEDIIGAIKKDLEDEQA